MRWVAAVAVVCACSSNAKTPSGATALLERAEQPAAKSNGVRTFVLGPRE